MRFITSLVLFLVLFSCTMKPFSSQGSGDKKLNALFESYWEERSKLFPFEATQQGDNRYNHLLPNDQTADFRKNLTQFYGNYLARLQEFKRDSLNENDKVSFDIFDYELKMQVEGLTLNQWMIPFHQFWALPLLMAQLGTGDQYQPFKTVQDYDNWLGRIDGFNQWTPSAIENFRLGMKSGVVLSRALVVKMIPQMKDLIVKDITKSLFYGPLKKFPASFSEEDKKRLTDAYVVAIKEKINPSYSKLATFLQKEYLPKSRRTHGIDGVKGGKEIYTYLAKYWTTTSMTPEEIHKIGLKEVARIRLEMEKVKETVKFKGPLNRFFAHVRTDKSLMPFKNPAEILKAFANIQKTIDPKLSEMFGRVPRTPFEIRQTEEFRAATASAEYYQGAADGSRPGIFYIPILDAKTFNITSGMESLFLHEAIPGHHYQISLQQENELLPKFRRFAWYGAYGEGWALYTESLGKELGLYTNPYQYMGALGDEMHRAIRLVVDVAIHTKGMTRDQAVRYMMDNEPISKEGAVAEVERYMAIPAQALSYKIGALKIRELRKSYEGQLGARFKLSHFHDEFLEDGCMPLNVMEKKMADWSLTVR